MPATIVTVPVGWVRFESTTGEPWAIRVARVEPAGDEGFPARAFVA